MTRRIAALVLALSTLVGGAACGDTEPTSEPGGGGGSRTEADGRDEQPDTYNDDDNDGESPHEG